MSAETQTGERIESGKRLGEDILTEFAFKQAKFKAEQLSPRPEFADCDREDIEQELLMYLIQKADAYDPTRSKLNTFISRVLDSGVRELVRAKKRHKRHPVDEDVHLQSFETPVETCDGSNANIGSEVSDEDVFRRMRVMPSDPLERIDEQDAIQAALENLSEELREVVTFMAENTLTATMDKFDLSRREMKKIRNDLMEHFSRFDAGFFWE